MIGLLGHHSCTHDEHQVRDLVMFLFVAVMGFAIMKMRALMETDDFLKTNLD